MKMCGKGMGNYCSYQQSKPTTPGGDMYIPGVNNCTLKDYCDHQVPRDSRKKEAGQ